MKSKYIICFWDCIFVGINYYIFSREIMNRSQYKYVCSNLVLNSRFLTWSLFLFNDKFFSRGTWVFLLFIRTSYVDGVKMANVGIFFDSGGVQSNSSSSNKLRVLGDKRKSISIFSSNKSNPVILNRFFQILDFSFSVWAWTFSVVLV